MMRDFHLPPFIIALCECLRNKYDIDQHYCKYSNNNVNKSASFRVHEYAFLERRRQVLKTSRRDRLI